MKPALPVVAIILLAAAPALPHRLDEYLQGAIISVEKNRVDVQLSLTPGVAVFPALMADIDRNADGVISESEQRAYAARVLHDLSIAIDGQRLTPHFLSVRFPAVGEMKDGGGEIRIEFNAGLPSGGPNRKLTFENDHERRIAAYQVNCLVPRDPDIRILAQNRNYSQSFYELDFAQTGVASNEGTLVWLTGVQKPLGTIALLLFGWLGLLWRRKV